MVHVSFFCGSTIKQPLPKVPCSRWNSWNLSPWNRAHVGSVAVIGVQAALNVRSNRVFSRMEKGTRKNRLISLKLTAKAPENGLGPKRKLVYKYSNHPFSGAKC